MKTPIKMQSGLLILNRNNIYIYTPNLNGFLNMSFPDTVIKNLEIVNQEELEREIKTFVDSSKILPAELTIVLSSDVLFEKEIDGGPEENETRQKFIDSLPFERIYKIVIPVNEKPHIITVNRNLIDGIISSFVKSGFTVMRAVPYEFLRKNSIHSIDVNSAIEIIKKSESMKLYNMLDYNEKQSDSITITTLNKNEKSSNPFVLYGLFGILTISVLGLIFFLLKR